MQISILPTDASRAERVMQARSALIVKQMMRVSVDSALKVGLSWARRLGTRDVRHAKRVLWAKGLKAARCHRTALACGVLRVATATQRHQKTLLRSHLAHSVPSAQQAGGGESVAVERASMAQRAGARHAQSARTANTGSIAARA